jgi:hypothetical protein
MKNLITFCSLLVFLFSCKEKESPVIMKTLNYPSASAVEYVNGKLYIMGDDATKMLVLDTNFNVVDSVQLFNNLEKRIPKNIKQDIESILFLKDSNKLMLLGSGSLSPNRDTAFLLDIDTKEKERKSLKQFYSIVRSLGIKEINIEGAVNINNEYIIANRGHLSYPQNNLIVSRNIFNAEPNMVTVQPIMLKTDSSVFHGISGLTYSSTNDDLIMTFSTEATTSTFEDGAVGKSFIWIIRDISQSIFEKLNFDKIIDLETIDPVFKGQKIESVTILKESNKNLRLVLVADNDNGSSNIFKLSIKID